MLVFITLLLIFLTFILANYFKTLRYWRSKGIKYVTPLPFIGNSLPTLLSSVTCSEYVVRLYQKYPGERCFGTFQYTQPILFLTDLDLIKRIFTKEFDTFNEHPLPPDPDGGDTLWGRNLFAAKGETWKNLRQVVSPAFTTTKLKSMFTLMDTSAKQMMEYLKRQDKDVVEVELSDTFKRYSSDTIASIAFGASCNSFKDKSNDFIRMGAELTNFSGVRKLKRLLYTVHPSIANVLRIKMHPDNVTNFFRRLVKDSISLRVDLRSVRPDYIQHFLERRKGEFNDEKQTDTGTVQFAVTEDVSVGLRNKKFALELTDADITAQALDFFYGGYYSTASLMCFCTYELAMNPKVQEKLRKEIDSSLESRKELSYDALTELKYLDMVISESLRKWPTATWIDRKSNKPITLSNLYLEAGTICWVPVFAIHRDPKYWPDPVKFDPERFSDTNRRKIVNYSFLPFGAGPRNCVGSRFAIVEAKLIIFYLIANYEVVPTRASVSSENPYLTSGDKFWFGLKRRGRRNKEWFL